jgi:hypothetical protein
MNFDAAGLMMFEKILEDWFRSPPFIYLQEFERFVNNIKTTLDFNIGAINAD